MNWKTGVVLSLIALLVVFVVQNYEVVEINFLFWSIKASRAIILFMTLFVGIIVGCFMSRLGGKD